MTTTLKNLKTEARDELHERWQNGEREDPDALIAEIAESQTPVYTHDLLEVADNDQGICHQPIAGPDIFTSLQVLITAELSDDLYEYFEDIKDEDLDDDDDLADD